MVGPGILDLFIQSLSNLFSCQFVLLFVPLISNKIFLVLLTYCVYINVYGFKSTELIREMAIQF